MNCYKFLIQTILISFSIIILEFRELLALNNGLARLPPMGWSTWNVFGCGKCSNSYGIDCLSENAIQDVAEALVREGFRRFRYEYIIIDDCWQSANRDSSYKLQPDAFIFPHGIKALAKYVHDRNLKLGIFSDLGQLSGGKYPGSYGQRYLELDAQTFADWDVDYVKMSAFRASPNNIENDYINFGDFLRRTNRNIVYATSWPLYKESAGSQVDYRTVAAHCNTWRFSGDSVPSWKSILEIMDSYATRQSALRVAHPGAWNDADLLLAGRDGITLDQAKAQMAVWCIMPSPLIFSADIRSLRPEMKALLQNTYLIDVNQDILGLPGYKLPKIFPNIHDDVDVWLRPITPTINGYHSFAVAFVNRNPYQPADYSITLQNMYLNNPDGYSFINLFPSSFSTTLNQIMLPSSTLGMRINPSGVVMYKAEALRGPSDSVINRTAKQYFTPDHQIIRHRTYDY